MWSSPQKLTFTYQAQRCDNTGGSCSPIKGATHSSYTLAAADAGHDVLVVVTARNVYSQAAGATAQPVGPLTS
jgi:hypothetical protein